MRILIVDDDDVSLEMLRHALTRAGHEVVAASHAREALAVVRGGSCKVVISDWEMPEMSGVELCRAIRDEDSAGYVYIILLTARGQSDVVEGLSAGADDFMSKPFNPAELSVRVRIGERILSLETRDLTIFAMAKLAESRDTETGAHLERVCNYSRILAQNLSTQPGLALEIDPGIPLCGRIVALADVYDALSSKRVYKEAFTHDVARSIILGDKGTHFDPDVVNAFLACEAQFVEVAKRFADSRGAAAAA